MKSYGQLWDRIIAEENLRAGWREFRRHHASKKPVQTFQIKLDENIAAIRARLTEGVWEPENYNQFIIYEPKPRVISCAPVKDRVVHHAFCRICTPFMERRFIDQSYACRKGRGSHLALRRARELCSEHRFYLKIDVRHYFDSIDHGILMGLLEGMFREEPLRELVRRIVKKPIPNLTHVTESSSVHATGATGLPIGNLTSQWFANLYLDAFDHFAVEELGLGRRYIRYMDDILAFFDTKEAAWAAYAQLRDWLAEKRLLTLKEKATIVAPVAEGIPYLGLRVWGDRWRFQRKRLKRTRASMKRRLYMHACGIDDGDRFQNIVRSMEGSARHFGFKGIYARLDRRFFDPATETVRLSVDEKLRQQLLTRHKHRNLGRRVVHVKEAYASQEKQQPYNTIKASGEAASSGSNNNRRKRGGSYNNNSSNCSSVNRNNNNYNNTNDNNGFRLASACENKASLSAFNLIHNPHPDIPALGSAETKMQIGATGRVSAAGAAAKVPSLRLCIEQVCADTRNFKTSHERITE